MKLQLKRSNVLDGGKAKEPTPPYVEYGELCVNYNVNDPALFIKDSNDNIIRIAGKNSVGSGSNPSGPNNPSTGNNIGDVFFNTGDLILYYWDGTQWVPIASQEHAADIYVGTFAEVDVEIPVAERPNGLLLWETEEGNLFLWYIDADTAQWVVAVPGGGGGGGASVAVLETAPSDATQGDLWYCTLDGRLYIYYQDVNTSQWVDASPENLAEGFWLRNGSTLSPAVDGDSVDIGSGNIRLNANGSATFTGTVTDNTSDIKFKTNIVDAPDQTSDVKDLQLRTWDWKPDAIGTEFRKDRHRVGLVAQEAEQVDSRLVYEVGQEEEEDSFKAIDYKVLTMKLLGALQESITRIEALEAKVQQLEGGN